MKRPRTIRIVAMLWVLTLLLTGLVATRPVFAGEFDQTSPKVSGLLSLRIQMKLQQLTSFSALSQSESQVSRVDILSTGETTNPNSEKVFLRFASEPTPRQISELTSLGITTYPDSWIPPVGEFKTGFILADMPVEKLGALVAEDYILNIDTAEELSLPQNDLARAAMDVGPVWSSGATGAGVTVAVIDSGIDATNLDLPPLDSTNSKDYSNYPDSLDDTIANQVTGHGTHVAASVLGRGVNSATYKGAAPEAALVFLKIGGDESSSATSAAIVGAIKAAVKIYHADIITMSYGGWSSHHDGTDSKCQAVDYAVCQGVTVFMSAGNNGTSGWHYSGTVPANSSSDFIEVKVTGADNETALYFNLVWFDGLDTNNDLDLQYYDNDTNPLSEIRTYDQAESWRGTENVYSYYEYYVPSGNGIYYLKVQNNSPNPQFFHIYYVWGSSAVSFSNPDTKYTLGSPAEADGAIAVGAYVTRKAWENYQGAPRVNSTQTLDSIATFSSRGPRVDDGAPVKPDIVAPGSVIFSARDNDVYPWPLYNVNADAYPYSTLIIDNDGSNLNGSGPADYFVMQGTSMACPLAAGVGALLLSKDNSLTPAQVKRALQNTAIDKGASGFDSVYGAGLINVAAAAAYQSRVQPQSVGGEIASIEKFPVLARWIVVSVFLAGVSWVIIGRKAPNLEL
jgi:subtilisin family serine protease